MTNRNFYRMLWYLLFAILFIATITFGQVKKDTLIYREVTFGYFFSYEKNKVKIIVIDPRDTNKVIIIYPETKGRYEIISSSD